MIHLPYLPAHAKITTGNILLQNPLKNVIIVYGWNLFYTIRKFFPSRLCMNVDN